MAVSRNWWDTADYISNIFGPELLDSDLYPSILRRGTLYPRAHAAVQSSGESEVKDEKDKFRVMLNISHFKPEEIEVKVVDKYVDVHGKHEEKIDEHGFVQREFTRRYTLPEGAKADTVKWFFSVYGVLTIEASKTKEDKFRVMFDVSHFKPEEIEVKVVDKYIVVHGEHEKLDDHGFVQREFTRRYMLPAGTDTDTVKSSFSVDEILTIEASIKVAAALPSNERVIPIEYLP